MFFRQLEILVGFLSALALGGCVTTTQGATEHVSRELAFTRDCRDNKPFKIIIHGGAGDLGDLEDLSDAYRRKYTTIITGLLNKGKQQLSQGQTAVVVVAAIISELEDDGGFNAGRGGVKNERGQVELDAAIMDGLTLKSGAVAGTREIKNPIQLARAIMEKTAQVLFVGTGADLMGIQLGFKPVNQGYFKTSKNALQLLMKNKKYGTVGAVVLDKCGSLAAGTSTGGQSSKPPGRVGDSPIIGAGTYANNSTLAVSMTGHGEMIVRHTAAHELSSMIKYQKLLPANAAKQMVEQLSALGAKVGLIAIDVQGNQAIEFNTDRMIYGFIDDSSNAIVAFNHP